MPQIFTKSVACCKTVSRSACAPCLKGCSVIRGVGKRGGLSLHTLPTITLHNNIYFNKCIVCALCIVFVIDMQYNKKGSYTFLVFAGNDELLLGANYCVLSHSGLNSHYNFMAVQEGPTGILVSWIPPTPLGDTTGYRIYCSGGSNGSVDISGASTHHYLLAGLQNGANYTISIVGTSDHLPSDPISYLNSIVLSKFQPV